MAGDAHSNAELNAEVHIPESEHGAGFPPFDATTYSSQILWLAITFGAFYWIMKNVAVPRISGILEDREDRIAGDLSEANRLKERSH